MLRGLRAERVLFVQWGPELYNGITGFTGRPYAALLVARKKRAGSFPRYGVNGTVYRASFHLRGEQAAAALVPA